MIVKTSFKSAKSYLATLVGAGTEIETERMGLRWFFSGAMKHSNESTQSKTFHEIENAAGRIDPEKADQGDGMGEASCREIASSGFGFWQGNFDCPRRQGRQGSATIAVPAAPLPG